MTLILTNERERSRFLRFAVVGAIGAVIDFGVMNLLRQVFFTPLVIAGTVSFVAAVLSNFVWNRYWTYPDSRSKPVLKQLFVFSEVSGIGLIIRIPTLYLLEPVFLYMFSVLEGYFSFINPKWFADNFTLAIAVIIVMFWNFFVNRYWTYNDIE